MFPDIWESTCNLIFVQLMFFLFPDDFLSHSRDVSGRNKRRDYKIESKTKITLQTPRFADIPNVNFVLQMKFCSYK